MAKILIVEDEVQLAKNIATYLQSYSDGLEILTVHSGEDALTILEGEPIDLLLTDVRLPGIDGIQVVRRAVDLRPAIKIIVMTAFGSPEVRRAASQTGAFRFVEKPLDLEELRQLVHQARPGERGFTGHVGGLDIFDVAQLLTLTGKSNALRVTRGKETGVLVFENGSLVHASSRKLKGETAFFHMASWEGGAFEEVHGPELGKYTPNISLPTTHLMMEAARLHDEAQRGGSESAHVSAAPEGPAGRAGDETGASEDMHAADPGEGRATPDTRETPNRQDKKNGKEKAMAIKDHLSEFQSVEGFQGSAVYSSSGELIEGVTAGSMDIKTIGLFANNALLNAQKATDAMGVGRGNMLQIRAPQATIVMRCLNEATDFAATAAGKAHFHTVLVLSPEGNVGMGTMVLDKVVGKIAEEMR